MSWPLHSRWMTERALFPPNYDTTVILKRLRDSTDRDAIDEEIAKLDSSACFPIHPLVRDLRRRRADAQQSTRIRKRAPNC